MSIEINNQLIGESQPVYIIAELSANHNGDFDLARKMIRAAKDAGADAVKLQTYTADTITIKCESELFRIKGGTLWDGKYLYDLYKEASTPWQWQPLLKEFADSIGITLFSSPFDKTAVDFLEEMEVPAYKIASFEAVDIPLIGYTAAKKKPVIISTGICSEEEIHEAIETCHRAGNNDVILLKCTSSYPSPLEKMNLLNIPDMRVRFKVPVGLSDHTMTIETNIREFSQMVQAVRNTEKLLGAPSYDVPEQNRKFARSLFVVKDIEKGEMITEENVRSIRPGYGLHPKHYHDIIGRKAAEFISKGTPLTWERMK